MASLAALFAGGDLNTADGSLRSWASLRLAARSA
jgi:hypothetical protein